MTPLIWLCYFIFSLAFSIALGAVIGAILFVLYTHLIRWILSKTE